MTPPAQVPTVLEHVRQQLLESSLALAEFSSVVKDGRIRARDREAWNRRLAGVVGSVETIRIWLRNGAPR